MSQATAGPGGTTGSAAPIAPSGQDGESKFRLSIIQVIASTAAAVTAAVLGSRLGVAGTLTGAALASVVSAVGAAIYGHSLLVTRRQVTKTLRLVHPSGTTRASATTGDTTSWPALTGAYDDPTTVMPRAVVPATPTPRRSRRPLIVVLAAAAAARWSSPPAWQQ